MWKYSSLKLLLLMELGNANRLYRKLFSLQNLAALASPICVIPYCLVVIESSHSFAVVQSTAQHLPSGILRIDA